MFGVLFFISNEFKIYTIFIGVACGLILDFIFTCLFLAAKLLDEIL